MSTSHPQRAALPRPTAGGPGPGSASSWLYAPQSMVTVQVTVTTQGLGGLVCLWLLLRASWVIQVLQFKLRQLAEECHRLNERWSAVPTARWQRGECPRCVSPPSERDWYIAPMIVKERPNDD